nr:HAMP domain-containing sensor histidine kinase [uncultured Mogibacterium sp.]
MKLRGKTFLYSVIISLIIGIVIFSYMVFLMPSMYMNYKENQNLENANSAMKYFKKHESLKKFKTGDANMLGVIVPGSGYTIKITGSSCNGLIEAVSPTSKDIIEQFRSLDMSTKTSKNEAFKNLKHAIKAFAEENSTEMSSSFKINLKGDSSLSQFKVKNKKFHYYNGGVLICEFSVENRYSGTSYTYFVGIAKHGDDMLILSSNTMTPSASEILPVLYGSTPMLILLMIVLAFGVSAIYSRKIVSPIKKLSMDAERRMSSSDVNLEPLEVVGNDEISDLTAALNLLYNKQAYAVQSLEEENKRKEVYMRATSHQLKTPIAASMLLVDGMIGKVGKFGDRDMYLPEVKAQLREMMSIIEETSNLNNATESLEIEKIDIVVLCKETLEKNRIGAEAKGITLNAPEIEETLYWHSDAMMLKKILENLIANGVDHTSENGSVTVDATESSIIVFSRPGHIDEKVIDDIFEPFVTGAQGDEAGQKKGHGLGLYIAKYFAGKLGLELRGENLQDGVQFVLEKRGRDD